MFAEPSRNHVTVGSRCGPHDHVERRDADVDDDLVASHRNLVVELVVHHDGETLAGARAHVPLIGGREAIP